MQRLQTFDDNLLFELLSRHIGHHVEVSDYGDGENMSLECEDCGCVIFDTDCYDLIGIV